MTDGSTRTERRPADWASDVEPITYSRVADNAYGHNMATVDMTDLPIARFRIQGFRTLADVDITCSGPLTVVAGPNNAGKSSLLSALRLYVTAVHALAGRPRSSTPKPGDEMQGVDDSTKMTVFADLHAPRFEELVAASIGSGRQADRAVEWARREFGGWLELGIGIDSGEFNLSKASAPRVTELLASLGQRQSTERSLLIAIGGQRNDSIDQGWIRAAAKSLLPIPTLHAIGDVRRMGDAPLTDDDLRALVEKAGPRPSGRRVEPWTEVLEQILQDVFGPETRYSALLRNGSGRFEISIDGQEDIPIEQVGAGVREVVAIAHAALSTGADKVLAIEEPENCLHPKAVRRLLTSLRTHTATQLFVSTHSSAVVNASPDTVIHVQRSGNVTTAEVVDRPSRHFEIIRSLGYTPADLVLTPCTVWVEGPSDRLYLTKWLSISGLTEGIEYQSMFYGGSLLAHVTAHSDASPEEALVAIRRLSRRCVVVADSDRTVSQQRIKGRVQRIKAELDKDPHGLAVITPGKEIENYLPTEIVNEVRASFSLPKLPSGDARFLNMVKGRDPRGIPKVDFARRALEILDGEVPQGARRDVNRMARFIRDAEPDHHVT
jgi:predicted ATPase